MHQNAHESSRLKLSITIVSMFQKKWPSRLILQRIEPGPYVFGHYTSACAGAGGGGGGSMVRSRLSCVEIGLLNKILSTDSLKFN